MKRLLTSLAFCFVVTFALAQNQPESRTKVIVGTFNGFTTDTFEFKNNVNDQELKFNAVEGEAVKKFNLEESQYIGRFFRITYRIDFIRSEVKKRDDKLSASQSPFIKTLTIIDLKELVGYSDVDDEKHKDDRDGGENK